MHSPRTTARPVGTGIAHVPCAASECRAARPHNADSNSTRRPFVVRTLLASCVLAACAVAAGTTLRAASASAEPHCTSDGVLFSIEKDGYRFDFQAVTGSESLWRTDIPDSERVNVAADEPARAAEMRRLLLSNFGASDPEDLRARHAGSIERLRRLGYL